MDYQAYSEFKVTNRRTLKDMKVRKTTIFSFFCILFKHFSMLKILFRGQGIWLLDKWEDAIDCGMKLQARLVQKYIEHPLIFSGERYGNLNNKKFDIRQWVLVNRMKPLQIYYFQNSYLRICNSDYTTGDINDLSRHLSNFCVYKQGLMKE